MPFLSPDPVEDPDEDEPELDEPESDEEDDFDEEDDESEEPEPEEPEEPESADDPDFESGLAPDGSLSLSFLPGPSPLTSRCGCRCGRSRIP